MPTYAEGAAGDANTSADTAGAPMVARACVASTTTGSGTGGGSNSKFVAVTWNKVATAQNHNLSERLVVHLNHILLKPFLLINGRGRLI